jgi:hypothetical protein
MKFGNHAIYVPVLSPVVSNHNLQHDHHQIHLIILFVFPCRENAVLQVLFRHFHHTFRFDLILSKNFLMCVPSKNHYLS